MPRRVRPRNGHVDVGLSPRDIPRDRPLGGSAVHGALSRWAEGSHRDIGGQPGHHRVLAMAEIVLRVRLTGGDHMDVTYEESDTVNADEVVEHVVSTLAQDSGVLRARHGDRLILLYGRGVAAVEVAPRGAVV